MRGPAHLRPNLSDFSYLLVERRVSDEAHHD